MYIEKYQLEIVRNGGLPPLLRLLRSSFLPLILSAAACVRNVSIHPANEAPIIDGGFLQPLIDLLGFGENEEVQCHAISTLRNLAASSERNKGAIVRAGAARRVRDLVRDAPIAVQSEMTACAAVLALSDDLKSTLLDMGMCECLIPLTASQSVEVQGNSAAALGNLSSKAEDYTIFNQVWNKPEGGLHTYLVRFLGSPDNTFQHIAVWTLVQLLESGDEMLINNIQSSALLLPLIRRLAQSRLHSPALSDHRKSHGEYSNDDESSDGYLATEESANGETSTEADLEGEGEIAALARRILEIMNDVNQRQYELTNERNDTNNTDNNQILENDGNNNDDDDNFGKRVNDKLIEHEQHQQEVQQHELSNKDEIEHSHIEHSELQPQQPSTNANDKTEEA